MQVRPSQDSTTCPLLCLQVSSCILWGGRCDSSSAISLHGMQSCAVRDGFKTRSSDSQTSTCDSDGKSLQAFLLTLAKQHWTVWTALPIISSTYNVFAVFVQWCGCRYWIICSMGYKYLPITFKLVLSWAHTLWTRGTFMPSWKSMTGLHCL